MSTARAERERRVRLAIERYRRDRQEIEDAYRRKDWYPEYGRDFNREVRECQRSLGAAVANIYRVTVLAAIYPRGETDARASTGEG